VIAVTKPSTTIGRRVSSAMEPTPQAGTRHDRAALTRRTARTDRAQEAAEAYTWQRSARQLVDAIDELWR
jgi:hypothetical protein